MSRQKRLLSLGNYGCYLLCLLRICEMETKGQVSAEEAFEVARASGWMDEDCYVKEPAKILGRFAGGTWDVTKQEPGYKSDSVQYVIQRWEWKNTGGIQSHFTMPDWDPMGDSLTVRNGRIVSFRMARRTS